MKSRHAPVFSSLGDPALVSVIIPTYNRCDLVRQAIESVLAQTYPAVELIVVDDGSTDGTPALLERYADRAKIIHQANRGGTAARNAGLDAASGCYITFLDHDDLILPDKIERQMRMLESQPLAGLVHCRWYFIDREGKRLDRIGVLPEGDVFKRLVCGCFIWSGGPLIRRQCLDAVGRFDETIWSSDWDLWVRIAQAGYRFACVQEPLGCYRVLPDSTMSDVARTESADQAILDKVFDRPPSSVVGVRDLAYATWRFWLGRRYYAVEDWDAARRSLAEAIRLHPPLLQDQPAFFQALCDEALDVRVPDAFRYIHGVLDHLPPEAEAIAGRRPYLTSCIHLGMSLRAYGLGQMDIARHHLSAAVDVWPALLHEPKDFIRMVCSTAMRVPGLTPGQYVTDVFHHLPVEAKSLAVLQPRVAADAGIASAFEDYFAGRRPPAARKVLGALRARPAWLLNRGVVSMLARSLPALLAAKT